MKNRRNESVTLTSFQGERGAPNVGEKQSISWKRGLASIFIFGGLLLTALFAYMSYTKSNKPSEKEMPKSIHVKQTIPTRTFELPAEKTQLALPLPVPSATNDLSPNTLLSNSSSISAVDKSASSLMIEERKPILSENSELSPLEKLAQTHTQQVGALSNMLTSTATPITSASVLKNRHHLLAKGSFIDCVLQTKLDSTVPGMTSCVVTRNIYGDTGKLLLIERGSTISGEYASNLKQGQARIFVLWNRVKTPGGVVINLNSPGMPVVCQGISTLIFGNDLVVH